jgi:hypothetical protein
MTSLLNMCSNCGKYEVAKTHLCGFNDWCEECDTSLWSTANDVTDCKRSDFKRSDCKRSDYNNNKQ